MSDEQLIDTSGFYSLDTDNMRLLWGTNGVSWSGCDLLRQFKDDYTYPVNGWYWCNSREEANTLFGLNTQ